MRVLGLLDDEELVRMAMGAIVDGSEPQTLLDLAICSPDHSAEIDELFRRLLKERGGHRMSKIDALKHYARDISASIVAGETSPFRGATLIWEATLKVPERDHYLDPFIYAASEMKDRPKDWDFFEKAIVEEAKAVLCDLSPENTLDASDAT